MYDGYKSEVLIYKSLVYIKLRSKERINSILINTSANTMIKENIMNDLDYKDQYEDLIKMDI